MQVTAKACYIRMSPRKVRLIVDAVRGLPVERALVQLKFMNKAAALPVYKVVASAMANAEHNHQLKREDLVVERIMADGGPTLHRWTPKAFGRSAPIRKRTTHITVVLADRAPAAAAAKGPGQEPGKGRAPAKKKRATSTK